MEMMKMMMKMMMMMMKLLFISHFSASFPLKGWVCESVENTGNTTGLLNTLQSISNKHTPLVNLTCVCLRDCLRVVQLNVGDSVIKVKESEREMLQDECVKLVTDLSVIEEPKEVPMLSVVTPLVGASVFIALLLLSFAMFNKQDFVVGGSLIHYPAHSLKNMMRQETLQPPETITLT